MTTLNKAAAEVDRPPADYEVHSVTDVTGFGLIGHAREMAIGSNVSVRIRASRVPLLPGALECVRAGHVPGGLKANRQFAEGCVEASPDVPPDLLTLLYDPQTAGGLLIAVSPTDADRLLANLQHANVDAVEIGETLPKQKPLIAVLL